MMAGIVLLVARMSRVVGGAIIPVQCVGYDRSALWYRQIRSDRGAAQVRWLGVSKMANFRGTEAALTPK